MYAAVLNVVFVLQNVVFVVSVTTGTDCHGAVSQRSQQVTEVSVGDLDLWDKAEVARSMLSTHRKQLNESPFNNQVEFNRM